MTRFLIRAAHADQFQQARALLDGRTRGFVTSERHLYLSTGDLPPDLQERVRATGARVTVEHPVRQPDGGRAAARG